MPRDIGPEEGHLQKWRCKPGGIQDRRNSISKEKISESDSVRTTQKFPLPATAVKKAFSRMMQRMRVVWINHMKKGKALVVKQQDQAVFWIPKADTVLRTGECSSLNNIEL